MRVRKRYLLPALALCCLVAAAVVYWATRPGRPETVFDEAAWSEAVEVLKAEVGPDAVANGAYRIPRGQVAVCDAGAAMLWRQLMDPTHMWPVFRVSAHFRCVVLDGGGGLLVACDTRNDPATLTPHGGIAIAPLERADAQRILRVFAYLLMAEEVAAPTAEGDDSARQRMSKAAEEVLLNGGVLPEQGGGGPNAFFSGRAGRAKQTAWAGAAPVQQRLRSCLAERYLNTASASGGRRPIRDAAEGASAAARMLSAAADNAHNALGGLLQFGCAEVAYAHLGPELEAPLRRIGRIEVAYQVCAALRNVPIVKELINKLEVASEVRTDAKEAAALLGVVESFSGKSDKERLETVAQKYLPWCGPRTRGADCPRTLIEAWPQLDRRAKLGRLRWAYYYFLDSPSLAETAADDSDPIIRCHGELILFQLTGDRAHLRRSLDALAQCPKVEGPGRMTGQLYMDAIVRLGALYENNSELDEIGASFRPLLSDATGKAAEPSSLFEPSAAFAMATPLLMQGGEENTGAALEFLGSGTQQSTYPSAKYMYGELREPFIAALTAADASAADFMVERILAGGAGSGTLMGDYYAPALGARGDERLTEIARQRPQDVKGNTTFARAALEARLRRAEDVPMEMVAIAEEGSDMQALAGAAVDALVARYSEEELMNLLADEVDAQLRGIIYIALVKRRMNEGEKR